MRTILVFCAWNRDARANYHKTILNPIPDEQVFSSFPSERHEELRRWRDKAGGFFAWGFRGGARTVTMLSALQAGDYILAFFGDHYRAAAHLLGKEDNESFAAQTWGAVPGSTEAWRYILFLTKPREIALPAQSLTPYLPGTYRGAIRLSKARESEIVKDFGSVEAFATERLGIEPLSAG